MASLSSRRRFGLQQLLQSHIFVLTVLWLADFAPYSHGQDDEFDEHLLCRTCGHEVATAADFIRVTTTQALGQRNDTILGRKNVLVQLLTNPQGRSFEVLTTSKANVQKQTHLYADHTWFEGYSWKIITCPHCRAHLGWYYEPIARKEGTTGGGVGEQAEAGDNQDAMDDDERRPFYGLILNYLIHQQYADSLVIKPKIYGG